MVAARVPFPIVDQLRNSGQDGQFQIYIFDPRPGDNAAYLLYRVEDGDICVPEYMDSRYSVDESLRCHYSALPKATLDMFRTALEWVKDTCSPDAKIIELGCGSGQFANMLFDAGFENYIGYDFSSVAIARAAELNPANRDCFLQKDIRGLVWPSAVETVIIFEVLEHLVDDIAVLKEVPSGFNVIFSVPNFNSFNHVRTFENLPAIIARYGAYLDFSRYQRMDIKNKKCRFLLQGNRI